MADPTKSPPLTRASVIAAHALVKQHVHQTPVLTNATLSALASTPQPAASLADGQDPARPTIRLWFKCENLQRAGAFKVRGAFHALSRLVAEEGWEEGGGRARGVVTHSSGNHAQALSLAAREMKIPITAVMPRISTPAKIAATQGYGARVVFSGSTAPERAAVVEEVIRETGATFVPPYDHPDIILGQGTLGLELQAQVAAALGDGRRLDAIVAPCGGGGMLSGTALSCEGTGVRVFSAEPGFEGADDCKRGLEAGVRVEAVSTLTIADGLRTVVGALPWTVIHDRKLVSGAYAVTEEQIKAALRLVLERMKVVVEPSAVVGLATVLYNEDFRRLVEKEGGEKGWDIGLVFSGGNVGLEALGELLKS